MKNGQKILALSLFFLSGFSALTYEIIWSRLLTLVFGTTIEAISAVITAFMFGLAFGSYFAGRHADYIRKHLSAYAVSEIIIGISSIVLYYTITNLPLLLKPLHHAIPDHPGIITTLIYLFNFLLVAVPTTLMGATFPLISKHYIRNKKRVGLGIGLLYAINTFGAVLGTFLCGFVLIPAFGVMVTHHMAAFISIGIGLLALASNRQDRRTSIFNFKLLLKRSHIDFSPLKNGEVIIILLVFFASGLTAMACEVVWTRLLIMVIGNSTYAFSAILTVFLTGIATGSFLLARYVDKIKDLFFTFALIQTMICLFILATLPFLDNLPFLYQYLFNSFYNGFASLEAITFLIVIGLIFIPTTLMGAAFPLANRLITQRLGFLGQSIGIAYSVNTVGGIFGAFLAGYYFIPGLGTEKTLLLISSINLLAAIVLLARGNLLGKTFKAVYATTAVTVLIIYTSWLPEWNKNYLSKGGYIYLSRLKNSYGNTNQGLQHFFDRQGRVKWFREGRIGTVSVIDLNGTFSVQVNGKTDGSTDARDMKTQIMLAALPLMLKGQARDVAVIGLGTGVTLGVAEQFPVERIDCIELSEEVVAANRFFSVANHDALLSPKLNLIITDARNYLTYTEKKYDVIINEPSNPWISGVSNLFTLEFFNIAKSRLRDKGIMAQWLHIYSMETKDLKILLHTFKEAFPHVSVWTFSTGDLIVIGSNDHEIDSFQNIEKAFYYNKTLYNDLKSIGLREPRDVMRGYLFGTEKTVIFSESSPVNTDNDPIIEFDAPKALHLPTAEENMTALKKCC